MAEETTSTNQTRYTSLLDQLGLDSTDVLSTANIASTLSSNSSEALKIYNAEREAAGVTEAQSVADTALSNFLTAQNLAGEEQLTIESRRKKLGVLRGEQAQAAQYAQQELQTLQTAQTLAQNALSSAESLALTRANLAINEYQQKLQLTLDYPGLKIDPLKDDWDKIQDELDDYIKDQEKDAEKDAYKQALRELGLSTKGSRKELEARLTSANASKAAQAKELADIELATARTRLAKLQSDSKNNKLENLGGGYYQDGEGNIYYNEEE